MAEEESARPPPLAPTSSASLASSSASSSASVTEDSGTAAGMVAAAAKATAAVPLGTSSLSPPSTSSAATGSAAATDTGIRLPNPLTASSNRNSLSSISPPTSDPYAPIGRGDSWSTQGGKKGNKAIKKNSSNAKKRSDNAPIVIGKSVNTGVLSWKGADLTVARYIGHVAVGVTADEIKSSLEAKGVDVVSLEPISMKHSRFLSFKLVLKKMHLPIIEDENFWPASVVIGRYWSPKTTSTSAVDSSPLTTGNGASITHS